MSFTVIGPDGPVSADALTALRADLISAWKKVGAKRVAVYANSSQTTAAFVDAVEEVGAQALLVRHPVEIEDESWAEWGVDYIYDNGFLPTGIESDAAGPGILVTTSGTTGKPKAALHDLAALRGRIRVPKDSENLRWLLTYHPGSYAGLQVILTAKAGNSTLIEASEPTVPALTQAAIAHQPHMISGTPTFWRGFLSAAGSQAADIPLLHATLGGEATDQGTLDAIRQFFPTAATSHIYASTETGALFAVRDGQAGFPASWLVDGIDGVQLRIVEGILEAKSPNRMAGYVGKSTNESEGFIRTGDLVEVTGDRVLFRGREDSIINVGGAKVMPEEVEAFLVGLPEVTDARVYGKPNPVVGALVVADIELAPGTDAASAKPAILAAAKAQLDAYKVPRVLNIVDKIEANASGKKDRKTA
jgi:acyl-CoA synthetase (AMP-forming)/AMP-acid ligase II